MDSKLHILQHSLGLDEYGGGSQYRNYFVADDGSKDFSACRGLVSEGLMRGPVGSALCDDNSIFYVTPRGIEYVALNSPPAPKLTRSQKRYREWLDAESGLTFAEWIGVKARRKS